MLFVYIHGFNSSPDSFKAKCFKEFLQYNYPEDQFICPKLSDLPDKAVETISDLIQQNSSCTDISLIGSSLGGFYATWFAEQFQLKAVLINPAVNPQVLLLDYIGKNRNFYTGEEYEFTANHIQQLNKVNVNHINSPKQLMVLIQTGDEILKYRLAQKKYSDSILIVEEGGDHSFQHFDKHCESIYQFLKS